jgi:hypothetical protein
MLLKKAVALGRAASSASGAAGARKVESEVARKLAGRQLEMAVESLVLPFLCPWINPASSEREDTRAVSKGRQASHKVSAIPSRKPSQMCSSSGNPFTILAGRCGPKLCLKLASEAGASVLVLDVLAITPALYLQSHVCATCCSVTRLP